jgi:peptide/nickel transport system substrate-binding protein
MHMAIRRSAVAVLLGLLTLVFAACGSSSSTSSGGSVTAGQTPAGQQLNDGVRGGTLNVLDQEDFQTIDPGQSYFAIDYTAIYATQRPLFSYMPNQAETVSPDLASGPAQVSADNKTVTVHIRPGVHFSPPVNREVTSSDVAYAIERGANPNVANPYFPAYFSSVVGADKANGGPLAGITTPDKYTIVFKLTKPQASILAQALSLPLSAPVPLEFAKKYDARKPTQYGNYQVASGPYMFKANAQGKVLGIGYDPGKSAVLVRNPNWNAKTDFRPAYLDQININIGGAGTVIGRQVLTGSHMVQNDTPDQSIVKLAYQQYNKQIVFTPGAGDHYVALDNKKGPFANVNLRRAFWAALDRDAMVKLDGGRIVGDPGTHFLFPGMQGYDEAGGLAGPQTDFNKNTAGDMAVATKYMKAAGYPSGKYTGSHVVTVVGASDAPANKTAEVVNQALLNLGFKTRFNLVDQSAMYTKYCGVPAQEIDVCPNVGWVRDFADPQTVIDPTFAGKNIVSTNNSNWSQTDDPQINKAIDAAELTNGTARVQAWAAIDRMLVDKAVAVPWIFNRQPQIESKDVRGITQVWNTGEWDFSFSSLK